MKSVDGPLIAASVVESEINLGSASKASFPQAAKKEEIIMMKNRVDRDLNNTIPLVQYNYRFSYAYINFKGC